MKIIHRFSIAVMMLFVLVGCSGPASSPPAVAPSATATEIPVPTSTPTPEPTPTETPLPAGISYLDPVRYQVTYTVVVRGGGYTFRELRVYQPMPVAWDAQQDVVIDQVTPEPTSQNLDAIGNGIYYWNLTNAPAAGQAAEFTIVFSFTAYETRANITPEDVLPYDTSAPLYRQYTRPERFIESDNPAIVARAAELANGETNPLILARIFYDYIIDTARYNRRGQGLAGARALLESGQGECGDYSSLFVALSRASGIPARPIVGYWAISGTSQTHVWAEFYLEGIGWVPVDPTIGQQSAANRAYYFGNMDNRRVILNKEFNIPLIPAAPGNYIAPFLQVPLFWYWGSGNDSTVSINRAIWSVTRMP